MDTNFHKWKVLSLQTDPSWLASTFSVHSQLFLLKKLTIFLWVFLLSRWDDSMFSLARRYRTSFQRLQDIYTKSRTSYRRLVDVETTSCVYWVVIFTPMYCRTLQTLFSSWSSEIDEGNATTSTHSNWEHWAFSKNCLSTDTICSHKMLLTFLITATFDSSFIEILVKIIHFLNQWIYNRLSMFLRF